MLKTLESRTLKSIFWGFILFVLNFAQNIVLVPFFLQNWGQEKYGLWISIFSLITLVKTIDLGHQNFVGNELTKLFFINPDQTKKLLNSSIVISLFLGFFELIIFIFSYYLFTPKTISGINNLIFDDPAFDFYLILFVSVFTIFGSIGGILVRILLPLGLFDRMIQFTIVYKLFEILILSLSIIFYLKISIIFLSYSALNFIYSLFVFIYTKKILPSYYPWWRDIDIFLGLRNLLKSLILTLNAFVEQFNTSGLVLLILNYIGMSYVTLFSAIRTSTNIVLQITSLIINPLAPELLKFSSLDEQDKILKLFDTNCIFSGILVNFSFLIVLPFVHYLFSWWTKGQLFFDFHLYLCLTIGVLFINFGKSYLTFLSSSNALKEITIITYLRIILTFGFSSLLIAKYHLLGIGYSIVIGELFCSLILPFYFVAHRLKLTFRIFIKRIQIIGLFQIIFIIFINYTFLNYNLISLILYFFTFLFLLFTSFMQWKSLDRNIKNRINILLKESRNLRILNPFS